MKIYTKTGDKGETSLYGGKRIPKSDPRIEAYGNIDELNSLIGLVIAKDKTTKKVLIPIQNDLHAIGVCLAGYDKGTLNLTKRTTQLEETIDQIDTKLPKLSNFILPGGTEGGASLHVLRSVARRTERSIIKFTNKQKQPVNKQKEIIQYINRLSDLFFILARYVNYKHKHTEMIWKEIS